MSNGNGDNSGTTYLVSKGSFIGRTISWGFGLAIGICTYQLVSVSPYWQQLITFVSNFGK